jgi:hypothetical protein
MDVMNLRGAVLSRFNTIGAFADAVGWKRNKASRVLNGLQEMDVSDIQAVTEVLGIDSREDFTHIFFPSMSTKWTA